MVQAVTEHRFHCPYCGESITILLDLSVTEQAYVEDCEVCCRPIEISYETSQSILDNFSAHGADE